MFLALHGVLLAHLLLALLWNLSASSAGATPEPGRGSNAGSRTWERWLILPLQIALGVALLRDRLMPGASSLLLLPALGLLFSAAFAFALIQNLHVLTSRGARLTDVPLVLYNVGVGICVALAASALAGSEPPAELLYAYALTQSLVGSHLALLSPLCWHMPLLLRRTPADTWPARLGLLSTSAFAAFVVILLVLFRAEAMRLLPSFEAEPVVTAPLRADLAVAVLERRDGLAALPAYGTWRAIALEVHERPQSSERPAGPIIVLLCRRSSGLVQRDSPAEVQASYLAAAEHVAATWQPEVLMPLPEPDGEAPLLMGVGLSPEVWRAAYSEARERVQALSPKTRVAVRLAGSGTSSEAIFAALAAAPPVVDIAGPRLHPAGSERGGPASVEQTLSTWAMWRASLAEPGVAPELWILGAGLSPLAYGERAQARFLSGCLQRAQRQAEVRGIVLGTVRDHNDVLGLLRIDGTARRAEAVVRAAVQR
ncbi:MAG: hypothetical protein ACT4PU_00100 [Planctomycetota bacterium]